MVLPFELTFLGVISAITWLIDALLLANLMFVVYRLWSAHMMLSETMDRAALTELWSKLGIKKADAAWAERRRAQFGRWHWITDLQSREQNHIEAGAGRPRSPRRYWA